MPNSAAPYALQGHRQSRVVVITPFLDRWSDAQEVEDLV
jgi:hypothetical protein